MTGQTLGHYRIESKNAQTTGTHAVRSRLPAELWVAAARILASEANHQLLHLRRHPGSARVGAVSGTIELAGNQPPIPRQDGVRFGCAGHLLQSFPSNSFSDLGQC